MPLQQRAQALADQLGLPKTRMGEPGCDLLLAVTEQRLELRVLVGKPGVVGGNPVYADPAAMDTASPAGKSLNCPLLKAVGIRKGKPDRPRVVDCTAGLGEDAWLLAARGCAVTALERQPVIAVLLDDALQRAAAQDPQTADRIKLIQADAAAWLAGTNTQADVILMDPMFPAGRKTTERKPMRVLRTLAGDDADAGGLFDAALATGAHRVVVKRPSHTPPLGDKTPTVVHKGRGHRLDVYVQG
ncbi:MAG: class I SAM-dependent methyltransferase [Planctomycetota bacterium]